MDTAARVSERAPGVADREPSHAVEAAVEELCRGNMVLVVDAANREDEGDLIMAAEHATAGAVAFMIRHGSGLLCVGITPQRADELALAPMVTRNEDARGTAFTVSVDRRAGTTTGVSAAERALTIRALVDATRPAELTRPGHVFPLRARPGGVLIRPGHTEAAVDLCRLAGLRPAGVLCELVNEDGSMARADQRAAFAERHGLRTVTIADIVAYRRRTERLVERGPSARLPTVHGPFTAITYRSIVDDVEHVALVCGGLDRLGDDEPILVRVHSECLTGDVFSSRRCDCGEQLRTALARIRAARRGVVVYLRGQEGRGIGLLRKLHAYTLQDGGLDTVDANVVQGLPIDGRDYHVAAHILHDLGVGPIRLMTNNPAKCHGLRDHGVRIASREPLTTTPHADNAAYLETKRTRLGHRLDVLEASGGGAR
jgi:3,4-dihydroxy 2-butanone 4-phosphate synthase / GTP cyclohydrolase II